MFFDCSLKSLPLKSTLFDCIIKKQTPLHTQSRIRCFKGSHSTEQVLTGMDWEEVLVRFFTDLAHMTGATEPSHNRVYVSSWPEELIQDAMVSFSYF